MEPSFLGVHDGGRLEWRITPSHIDKATFAVRRKDNRGELLYDGQDPFSEDSGAGMQNNNNHGQRTDGHASNEALFASTSMYKGVTETPISNTRREREIAL